MKILTNFDILYQNKMIQAYEPQFLRLQSCHQYVHPLHFQHQQEFSEEVDFERILDLIMFQSNEIHSLEFLNSMATRMMMTDMLHG